MADSRSARCPRPETVKMEISKMDKQQLTSWAGVIGSALFIAVFALQDIFCPGFNWLSTAVSEHALGSYGWIQIANFIVVGLLFLVFARGVAEEFREGTASRLKPLFLTILGFCILLSGPFVTDPAPAPLFSSRATWHGTAHGVMGGLLGLFQRIVLIAYFGWTFAFAMKLRSHKPASSMTQYRTMSES